MDKEKIHDYFGLSYANYLVLPRSVLQSMPDEWQEQFVGLLNQILETIDEEFEPEGGYRVLALDKNKKFKRDPYSNYERGRRQLKVKKEDGDKLDEIKMIVGEEVHFLGHTLTIKEKCEYSWGVACYKLSCIPDCCTPPYGITIKCTESDLKELMEIEPDKAKK